ncbi:MAG: hypothetical protein UT48_C0035G0007 [Parcubacteria group bacterium GW2011_GWE2_39_37]|nr:MAG: hypothetical protein UT48_C0035G0007 [Parcubacteria group bacterium GW2011_GWE2_39_37]
MPNKPKQHQAQQGLSYLGFMGVGFAEDLQVEVLDGGITELL